jgi:hypothetical protein
MLAVDRWFDTLTEVDKTYDLRIYETHFIVSISKDKGGEMQEVQTEIRAIPKVTIVRTVGLSRSVGNRVLAKISVKFALLGQESRVKYRDKTLIPQMSIVKGLQIHQAFRIHRINVQGTIRKVREGKERLDEYGFYSYASNFIPRKGSKKLPTPRLTIQQMIDDYADSDQRPYDMPTNTADMAYHVMLPVGELRQYVSNFYRGDSLKYDSAYTDFIGYGAKNPVFLAIGGNRRAKVTGNEDLIFFAIEAGLEELPVFISYQRQV